MESTAVAVAAPAADRPVLDLQVPDRHVRSRQIEALRTALAETRHSWRWHWGRFWTLRWENTLRRPGWRAEEENHAWHRMRDEVRRYASLRVQIHALERETAENPVKPCVMTVTHFHWI